MTPLMTASAVAIESRLTATDLQVFPGQLIALIGPNGGGKTSLLRALARIDRPNGKVWIGEEDVDDAAPVRRRQLLSFLPASRDVPWPITARDLVALGLATPDPERMDELLVTLELQELANRRVDRLSTGERARVLLARALAPRPAALLLDEPLSNLDPYWVLRTLEVIGAAIGPATAAIVALHDLSLLDRFTRVLLVADGRVLVDTEPHSVMRHETFSSAFRIEQTTGGWRALP